MTGVKKTFQTILLVHVVPFVLGLLLVWYSGLFLFIGLYVILLTVISFLISFSIQRKAVYEKEDRRTINDLITSIIILTVVALVGISLYKVVLPNGIDIY